MKIERTPLVNVDGVLVKLECVNPCGSIKDRIALYILKESEHRRLLRPGMRIVEATSGNTGIAFAYYGRRMGYDVTIVMPEHMTEERKDLKFNITNRLKQIYRLEIHTQEKRKTTLPTSCLMSKQKRFITP
mgnify:CR=1 FL=1